MSMVPYSHCITVIQLVLELAEAFDLVIHFFFFFLDEFFSHAFGCCTRTMFMDGEKHTACKTLAHLQLEMKDVRNIHQMEVVKWH